jgi:hypothetical protein
VPKPGLPMPEAQCCSGRGCRGGTKGPGSGTGSGPGAGPGEGDGGGSRPGVPGSGPGSGKGPGSPGSGPGFGKGSGSTGSGPPGGGCGEVGSGLGSGGGWGMVMFGPLTLRWLDSAMAGWGVVRARGARVLSGYAACRGPDNHAAEGRGSSARHQLTVSAAASASGVGVSPSSDCVWPDSSTNGSSN